MLPRAVSTLRTTPRPALLVRQARAYASSPAPHPLSRRATPSGPAAARPGAQRQRPPQREQKWSNLTLILLATLTGSVTYALGRVEGSGKAAGATAPQYSPPTQERFDRALEEIKAWLPAEEMDQSRDTLVSHGYNEWAAHGPTGLPGAVLYPRSTDDVARIVKSAAKHGIPVIPYCAGTSLEGEYRLLYPSRSRGRPRPARGADRGLLEQATRLRSAIRTTLRRNLRKRSSPAMATSKSTISCRGWRSCSTLRRT